jgi:hypothetical protein
MPTAAQTRRFTMMSVIIIAIAGNGSLLRYGICAWYVDALFDALRKNDGLPSASLPTTDEGREVVMLPDFASDSNAKSRKHDLKSARKKKESEGKKKTKLARRNIGDAAPAEAPWDVDDAKWGSKLLS